MNQVTNKFVHHCEPDKDHKFHFGKCVYCLFEPTALYDFLLLGRPSATLVELDETVTQLLGDKHALA